MALFGKKKAQDAAEPVSWEVSEDVEFNLTDKMVRVEVVEDSACLKQVEISESDDMIRLTSGGILVALVGKRGKAYGELKPYVGKNAAYIVLRPKTGDYGAYYSAKLRFRTGRVVTR